MKKRQETATKKNKNTSEDVRNRSSYKTTYLVKLKISIVCNPAIPLQVF